jgi:hypothetical protein
VVSPTQAPVSSMTVVPFTVTLVGLMSPTASFATSAYGTLRTLPRGDMGGSLPTLISTQSA